LRENVKQGDHLKDLEVDGRITRTFILKKWDGRIGTGPIWFIKSDEWQDTINMVMNSGGGKGPTKYKEQTGGETPSFAGSILAH
jgi:hypothetical protein